MIVEEERQAKTNMPQYKGLERYRILEKMGDGAFSNVYKAQDLITGQKVAIKVVRKYELNSQQAGDKHLNPQFKKKPRVTERANILKEVQIMRGTDHPSIVRLYAFSESAEFYYLVLERQYPILFYAGILYISARTLPVTLSSKLPTVFDICTKSVELFTGTSSPRTCFSKGYQSSPRKPHLRSSSMKRRKTKANSRHALEGVASVG